MALFEPNAYNLASALLLKFFEISFTKLLLAFKPYFDGNLIAGSDEEELARRLETTLHRFSQARQR
ncbi:hypothetical protein T06_10331 [Trichinella sp. T6]|nr:hypothetical protein T06_10331 [Trichinella sp. T6]